MTTLVGKRISFEEEIPRLRDSPITDYKRSIRKGDKIENLRDVQKKNARLWAQSTSQQYRISLDEIWTVLEQFDYDIQIVDSLLKQKSELLSRQQVHASLPKIQPHNEELVDQATQHLFQQLKNVQNISQAELVTCDVFEKVKCQMEKQNQELTQITDHNKILKQAFLKQFQKTQRREQKYEIDSKEHQQQLAQEEDEIRKLQLVNKTLTVFLKQGQTDQIYNNYS